MPYRISTYSKDNPVECLSGSFDPCQFQQNVFSECRKLFTCRNFSRKTRYCYKDRNNISVLSFHFTKSCNPSGRTKVKTEAVTGVREHIRDVWSTRSQMEGMCPRGRHGWSVPTTFLIYTIKFISEIVLLTKYYSPFVYHWLSLL